MNKQCKKDLTGLQIGHIFVIKKQFNPNVKAYQDKYYIVEIKGKQKLMRYDNILKFGKVKEVTHLSKNNKLQSPKQVISKAIANNDDTLLAVTMLTISRDIINKLEELKEDKKYFFVDLFKFIEEYMNSPKRGI